MNKAKKKNESFVAVAKNTTEVAGVGDMLSTFFNGNKRDEQMFRLFPKRDKDGNIVDPFTKRGGEAYSRFADVICFLYHYFEKVGDVKNFIQSVENLLMEGGNTPLADVLDKTDKLVDETENGY